MTIEIKTLREYLSYNPDSGEFVWIKSTHPKQVIGTKCGAKTTQGYLCLSVNKQVVLAHRAAIAMVTGSWPVGVVDHINMNTTDNRLCNLRDVPRRVNQENRREPQTNSSTGLLGAFKFKNTYRSQIKARGKLYNLGLFNTAEEAHEAYLAAKRKLHEGNTL